MIWNKTCRKRSQNFLFFFQFHFLTSFCFKMSNFVCMTKYQFIVQRVSTCTDRVIWDIKSNQRGMWIQVFSPSQYLKKRAKSYFERISKNLKACTFIPLVVIKNPHILMIQNRQKKEKFLIKFIIFISWEM